MLELWGMPSHPTLLWHGVVAHDRALSMGHIELWHLNWVQTNHLNWIVINRTVLLFNCV